VSGRIVIAGSLAGRPDRPGHAWAFLGYLLGFRELGFEVIFLDRLDAVDADAAARSPAARWLAATMASFGLDRRWSLLLADGRTLGLTRERVLGELRECRFLLDVNGFLTEEELLAAAPRRVYLDVDPGYAQLWAEQGLADTFAGHDDFVTVGTNVGARDCTVPTLGLDWITTLPPVPLEHWPARTGGEGFTSVGAWRGPFGPLEQDGRRLGQRAHAMRRFAELPRTVGARFELALEREAADAADVELLRAGGWEVSEPLERAGDLGSYAAFIGGSAAEVSIAKELYVRTRAGWFSDRSATYLAAGKPVIALDTGFGAALPTGAGLLAFTDPDEAAACAAAVLARPREHAEAARRLAVVHLDARRVLDRLLVRLGER
jgi:hypothetical protein